MTKRTFAIILLLIMMLLYASITANAVYNVEIVNGTPTPQLVDKNGNAYVDGGTGVFVERYKALIVFAGGLGTITMVGAALYNVARLNITMSNPMQRQQCIRGIVICGLFAALMGSSTLFIGLFYGLLR